MDLSNNEMQRYLAEWDSKGYADIDASIFAVISANQGHDLDHVRAKVAIIRAKYHPGVIDVEVMARHISDVANVQERLNGGDLSLVNDIAQCRMARGQWYYCFASKYCSFHNPDGFPIYDYFVKKVVWRYINEHSNEGRLPFESLRRYDEFVSYYKRMIRESALTGGYKNIDKYLWQLGKKLFR